MEKLDNKKLNKMYVYICCESFKFMCMLSPNVKYTYHKGWKRLDIEFKDLDEMPMKMSYHVEEEYLDALLFKLGLKS